MTPSYVRVCHKRMKGFMFFSLIGLDVLGRPAEGVGDGKACTHPYTWTMTNIERSAWTDWRRAWAANVGWGSARW